MELISLGGSGWPLVSDGSVLRVQSKSQYAFGDLVVFCGARIQICHRVLSRRFSDGIEWYLIKGDANLEADGWVPAYRILGCVVAMDQKSTDGFAHRVLSTLMAIASLAQWRTYEWIFQSFVGVRLRFVREKFWPSPLLVGTYRYVSAPWLLMQPKR
ncbi:MAG: hypothetical protein KDD39_05365 [Bdellovibrionales bacterium]|nr:hypothetical protein [Bdellovibrionales bacterium]